MLKTPVHLCAVEQDIRIGANFMKNESVRDCLCAVTKYIANKIRRDDEL